MTTLIERIEAAQGPDRELDRLIQREASNAPDSHWFLCYTGAYVTDDLAAEYTASIDAALTLVPDGWTGLIPVRGGDLEEAWLWPQNGTMAKGIRVTAATPALAICAAALRAREAKP